MKALAVRDGHRTSKVFCEKHIVSCNVTASKPTKIAPAKVRPDAEEQTISWVFARPVLRWPRTFSMTRVRISDFFSPAESAKTDWQWVH